MQIKIFTTTTCPYCKLEKAYLDSKSIKYENIFVDEDEEQAKKMIEESGQMGVPFTEITKDDGSVTKILGFDKPKINEALGISS
jgi:glutaredoxin